MISIDLIFLAFRIEIIGADDARFETDESIRGIEKYRNPLECGSCGLVLKSEPSFQKHMKLHSQGKLKYKCSVCSKTFKTKYILTVHMRCHTNERPYICEVGFFSHLKTMADITFNQYCGRCAAADSKPSVH